MPGIVLTLALLAGGGGGFRLVSGAFSTYASTYAGFAAPMMALVFLYFLAVIFIAGGELNAAIDEERAVHRLT